MRCGVGHRCGLDLALLWHRLAAAALFQPLAWEHLYAAYAGKERKKEGWKERKKERKKERREEGKKGERKKGRKEGRKEGPNNYPGKELGWAGNTFCLSSF